MKKKSIALLMALVMVTTMLASCATEEAQTNKKSSKKKKQSVETTLDTTVDETKTEETFSVTEETQATFEYAEMGNQWADGYFKWTPYVEMGAFDEVYGVNVGDELNGFVEAIFNREYGYTYDSATKYFFYDIGINVSCFPLLDELVDEYHFDSDNNTIYLTYKYDEDEQALIVENFKERIEEIINSCVEETDNDTMIAIELYHYLSSNSVYDHDAIDGHHDVSAYRMIMENAGICQSFSGAYAYLLMQCGIQAIPCSGYNDSDAHEWVYVKLDGEYYHMDPTFENGYAGTGTVFFGMTNDKRAESGYPVENFNISNTWIGDEVQASDERFASLWDMFEITEITRDSEGMVLTGYSKHTLELYSVVVPY